MFAVAVREGRGRTFDLVLDAERERAGECPLEVRQRGRRSCQGDEPVCSCQLQLDPASAPAQPEQSRSVKREPRNTMVRPT
jgi:hypothetical protein